MKLTYKEIQEQKKLFGASNVNFFVRFMDARNKWRFLPEYFIIQVLRNSENIYKK